MLVLADIFNFSLPHRHKASQVVLAVKNLPAMQETLQTWGPSLGQKDPLEEDMTSHPVILPGESHGQRSLVGFSPWGHKESDTTERLTHAQHRQCY